MTATFALDGALDAAQGGNDTGAASTGIGIASNQSGPTVAGNFTTAAADAKAWHIGGGNNDAVAPSSVSASNTGQVINPLVAFVAGSGYTNGTYRLQSNASGGQPAGAAELEITIAGGAVTAVRVVRPGSGFTGAPTFSIANAVNMNGTGAGPGAGVGATFTAAVGLLSQLYMLGAGFGAEKNTQRLTAIGAVAIGAAVAPSTYLNRSGRAMVAGDSVWAVEP